MEELKINIINPKARKLLHDLADQKWITIEDTEAAGFMACVSSLRKKNKNQINKHNITHEVEKVRRKRHDAQSSGH